MNEEGEIPTGEPTAPLKRARYLHPLEHYVSLFDRSVRSLKGWIAIGRDAKPPELPPFDDPPRMKDWWLRHMAQRVPDDISALAVSAAPPPLPPPVSAADAAAGPLFAAAAASSAPPSAGAPRTVGYAGALHRLREAEAAAGDLYTLLLRQAGEATRTADERARLTAEAEHARRAWDDLVNRLRPMEKDAAEILAASGRLWAVDDVIAANVMVHLVLRESVAGLLRRVRPRLFEKPIAEQDAVWDAEVESMFAALRESKFTAPALPDVAA